MRTMMVICVCMLALSWVPCAEALPVTGQVVDSQAQPVEGAQVAVYGRFGTGGPDYDAKVIGPIVTTDAQGRFQLQADEFRQRNTFIVARKEGLAMAWDGLNYGGNTKAKGHFLLVLEPSCAVAGQLVDADGHPVAGAEVQVLPVTSYLDRLRQRRILAPKAWFTTTTDSQGRFRLGGFAADVSVSFRVKAVGCDSIQVMRPQRQNSCGYEVWRSNIHLQFAREATVKGRVVDEQGQPVAGIDLMISPGRSRVDVTRSYLVRKTTSDAKGTFTFEDIREGPSQIDVLAPEQGPDLWFGKRIDVFVQADATTEITVPVGKGGVLEVTARSAKTKRPLPGATVSAYGPQWRRSAQAIADANGVARLRAPAGDYTVYVGADQFSTYQSTEKVVAGQTLRYDALLSISPRVYGRVLDPSGAPVRGAAVSMHPFGDRVYTDNKGRFDGACDERRAAKGGFAVARDVTTGTASVLPVEDWSKPINLSLGPAWTLTGSIVDPDGVGIPAARVSLCLNAQYCLSSLGVEVLTDSQGRYEMKAIPPVCDGFTYRLSVASAGYGPREYLRISPSGAPGEVVDIRPTELPLADQSISGVVVDANGAPAAHVPIFVNGLAGVSQPSKATATNEKGEFAIKRLCQGRIRLQANFSSSPGGAGYVKAELPAQDLKIVLGQELTHEPEMSILGKPLPDLKGLGLSAAQVGDKAILMCFFDMQQRPSRNRVLELARRTQEFKQKGTAVLVVQASMMDEAALKTWVQDNEVAFPVGMVQADEEKTRLAWGVKSLPWLILTDSEHKVVAEGFAMDELEDHFVRTTTR